MKFIIWTPIYRDNSGGIIVLHKLAKILQDAGHVALIWPQPKPSKSEIKSIRGWIKYARWIRLRIKNFLTSKNIHSPYGLKVARNRDISGAVIVYPEIAVGNPLRGSCVVRWLLNKPGVINGKKDFGSEDLFFYYHEHFNDWDLNPHKDRILNVTELMSKVYKNWNGSDRSGQCYMVRKGRNRELSYHNQGAKKVDGLTHEELAQIFNECKYFICYDLYTMYCRYAAMCGCIPVVVPQEGLSKEKWRPEVKNRYGIAYGFEDVPWALETREKLFEHLADVESNSIDSVKKFVVIVQHYFNDKLQNGFDEVA